MADRLVLASGSPRRRELLAEAGYLVEVVSPDIDERLAGRGLGPEEGVIAIAMAKAASVDSDAIVIGADTVVLCGGHVLGKPKSRGHALALLRLQSGQLVTVLTGVVVRRRSTHLTGLARTDLSIRQLTDADMFSYLDTGEADDKAGALAVQGAARGFVTDIDGSWSNVLGLPMEELEPLLAALGFSR